MFVRLIQMMSGFSPPDISGLIMWLPADTLSLANNAAVSTWTDQSTTGRNATQATGTKQPLFKTSVVNGLPGVLFDGVDDYLTFGTNLGFPMSIFVACRLTSTPQPSYAPVAIDGGANGFRVCVKLSTANWGAYNGGDVSAGEALSASTMYLLELAATSSQIILYRAGVQKQNAIGSTPLAANDIPMLGAERNVAGRFFSGHIFEVVAYNTVLSDFNRKQVEAYLTLKWSLN